MMMLREAQLERRRAFDGALPCPPPPRSLHHVLHVIEAGPCACHACPRYGRLYYMEQARTQPLYERDGSHHLCSPAATSDEHTLDSLRLPTSAHTHELSEASTASNFLPDLVGHIHSTQNSLPRRPTGLKNWMRSSRRERAL
eukprot:SAG11_NODE_991_length_6262_cov_12.112607_4_plen_142_part_00